MAIGTGGKMELESKKYEQEYVYYVPYTVTVPEELKDDKITRDEAITMMRDFLDFCEYEYTNTWRSVPINQDELKVLFWLMNKIVREEE